MNFNAGAANDFTNFNPSLLSQLQQQHQEFQTLLKSCDPLTHGTTQANQQPGQILPPSAALQVAGTMQNTSGNMGGQDFMMGAGGNDKGDETNEEGMDVQGELDRDGQHHPIAEFLYQLTKMLTDDNSEIIEWADGRIKVHYPERLEAEVLHKYFRHSKFASFQRQLNYFGFRKIAGKGKMSPCSYVNDAATSDIRSLLLIKRKTNGSAARKAAMQQRAAALANTSLNPLLQFPGAAAVLANNPAALASLANPQALSGAMALLSDNALRAGLLAQQAGAMATTNAGPSPQLSLLLQQQQLQQQQQQQQQQQTAQSAAQSLLSNFKQEESSGALNGLPSSAQPHPGAATSAPAPVGGGGPNGLLHVDHSQIAQQTQQLQQLQQQLQQLQQQQRQQQQQKPQAPTAAAPTGPQAAAAQLGAATAALNEVTAPSASPQFPQIPQQPKEAPPSDAAAKPPAAPSSQQAFEQLLAARLAAANQNAPASNALGALGAASAALKLQLPSSGGDNPASAALQQQLSSMPATAAIDSDPASAQASNNLFESALNLKSLLQEHQAANNAATTANETSGAAAPPRALMNRLPSSGTIFPSAASFGNLLNSSNRLSSLLSLSSFVGGAAAGSGPNAVAPPAGANGSSSREPSLADLAAAVIQPNNVAAQAPLSAAALAAIQQHANPASAAANQFRTDGSWPPVRQSD